MSAPTAAIAEIDLNALCDNYRLLAAKAARGCAAVIKANAYGLGAAQVATALSQAGCGHFYVASITEGATLRAVLPQATIGVFYGIASAEDADVAVEHGLTPCLNHRGQVELWRDAARKTGRALPASLHVDTGMNRLGLPLVEAERLALDKQALEGIALDYIMSHLACAGTPDHALNRQQLDRFVSVLRYFPDTPASLANSSGVFLGEAYHFDLCRPGAALYGINPTDEAENPMRPVVTVKSPILQIRMLEQAEFVGYGATYHAPKGSRLATVAGGYADGLLRSMGNRTQAWVAGHHVPLAGIVSMDLTVVDISALPADAVREGDMVEFVGRHIPVDVVAAQCGTIGYEVFTGINSRVRRVFI